MTIRTVARVAGISGVVLIGLLLSSCGVSDRAAPAEERINRAFPLQEPTRAELNAIRETPSELDGTTAAFERELAAKLKIRALSCAQGDAPRLTESEADIRNRIRNEQCFAEFDAALKRWAAIRRTGLLLALSPLRPIPTKPPAALSAPALISAVRFARDAGVVMVQMIDQLQLLDLGTGEVLSSLTDIHAYTAGEVSSNGRVFIYGTIAGAELRETSTGRTVLELPNAHAHQVNFLDDRRAIYQVRDTSELRLLDFETGSDEPIKVVRGGVTRAIEVEGRPDEYVLFQYNGVSKVGMNREGTEVSVRLLDEQPCDTCSFWLNTSDPTPDRAGYVATAKGSELVFISLANLKVTHVDLTPFRTSLLAPTSDPNRVLFSAYMPQLSLQWLLYDGQSDSVSAVDVAALPSTRFVFCPSLRSLALIAASRLVFLDTVPVRNTQSRTAFLMDGAKAVASAAESSAAEREPENGPIRQLSRDARLEAVGVYEGATLSKRRAGVSSPAGSVTVIVRRSAEPIVLLLASYRGVTWNVIVSPGARLRGILTSSHEEATVVGADNVRVFSLGQDYAYERTGSGYRALQANAYRTTGLNIAAFQGRYSATTFTVGGE